MSLGKEESSEEVLSWPSISMREGVACMLDACGLPLMYRDTPKTPGALMHLFEELCRACCG